MLIQKVAPTSRLMTDESNRFDRAGKPFKGGHFTVNHSKGEYVKSDNPDVTTNRIESAFARVKRQLHGTYHAVSKKHLPRYIAHAQWLHNNRGLTDGDRVRALIQDGDQKRLTYAQQIGVA